MRRRCLALLHFLLVLVLFPSLVRAQPVNGLACGSGCPDQLPVCNTDNQCGPCVQDSQCKGGKVCDVAFGHCVDLSAAKYGGGCNSLGSSAASASLGSGMLGGLAVLMGLFFWSAHRQKGRVHRLRAALGLLIGVGSLALASEAAAQTTAPPTVQFNAQTFRPVVGPGNLFTVDGTLIGRARFPMGAVLFEFAGRPLRLLASDGSTFASTVRSMSTVHVLPGFTIAPWLALSADVPIVVYQAFDQRTPDSHIPVTPSIAGVGDVRLMTKIRIKNNEQGGLGLAAIPQFTFPTGSADDLRGDNTVGIEPRLAVDYRFKRGVFIALNVGYYLRTYNRSVDFGLTRVADQLRYGIGLGLPIAKGFGLAGEVNGATSFYRLAGGDFYTPLEGYLGARYTHTSGFEITAGGGSGFLSAPGSPQYRAFISIGYVPTAKSPKKTPDDSALDLDQRRMETSGRAAGTVAGTGLTAAIAPPDPDQDGVLGALDACPNEAGALETKGCPDADKDGIADRDDSCKDEPGLVQHKGCPPPITDEDTDGLLAPMDKCPTQAGPKENDGCPDQDQDKDGIVDRLDKCPATAATGTTDGCPLVEVKEDEIKLGKPIQFTPGSDALDPVSKPVISALARAVHDDPAIKKIQMTVSASGDKKAAKKLVKKRVKTLTTALDNAGVPKKQLKINKAKDPGEDLVSHIDVIRGKVKAPREKKEKPAKKERHHRRKKTQ